MADLVPLACQSVRAVLAQREPLIGPALLEHVHACGSCSATATASALRIALAATGAPLALGVTVAASVSATSPRVAESGARKTVGRFQIARELGAGAMGVVYQAVDPSLQRDVALKVVKGQVSEHAQELMRREAQAMAKLNHQNAVRVYETGQHDGETFIAMELVRGGTLRRWLATARTPHEIAAAFVQAADGLIAAHDIGLVHRDFKLDNVLVDETGQVKVSDFGLARAARGTPVTRSAAGDFLATPMTQSGAIVGTPVYMAPEQLLGDNATTASDQFAFCVSLYEALYGQRPFDGRTLSELHLAIEVGPRRPIGQNQAAWLWPVIERGLAFDPRQRFADMQRLRATLVTLDRRKRRQPYVAAAVASSVAVGAAIAMLALRPPPPADELDLLWNAERNASTLANLQQHSERPAAFIFAAHERAATVIAADVAQLRRLRTTAVDADQRACLRDRTDELAAVVTAMQTATVDTSPALPTLGSVVVAPERCVAAVPPAIAAPAYRPLYYLSVAFANLGAHVQCETAADALLVVGAGLDDATRLNVQLLRAAQLQDAHAMRAAYGQVLAQALQQHVVHSQIRSHVGLSHAASQLGQSDTAKQELERARTLLAESVPGQARNELGYAIAAQASSAPGVLDDDEALAFSTLGLEAAGAAFGKASLEYAHALIAHTRAQLTASKVVAVRDVDFASQLQTALELCRKLEGEDSSEYGLMLVQAAKVHMGADDSDGAYPLWVKADQIALRVGGPSSAMRIEPLLGLAGHGVATGSPSLTARNAQEAIDIAKKHDDRDNLALGYSLLSQAQLALGTPRLAKQTMRQAVAARGARDLASYIFEADIDIALGDVDHASAMVTQSHAPEDIAIIYRARIASVAGDHVAAERLLAPIATQLLAATRSSPVGTYVLELYATAVVGAKQYQRGKQVLAKLAKTYEDLGITEVPSATLIAQAEVAQFVDHQHALAVTLATRAYDRAVVDAENRPMQMIVARAAQIKRMR